MFKILSFERRKEDNPMLRDFLGFSEIEQSTNAGSAASWNSVERDLFDST